MGLFDDPNDEDIVQNANGTSFQYNLAENKWVIIPDVDVYSEAEVDALLHAEAHSIASHNDTTATGAELETLTDGSETDLHSHAGNGGVDCVLGGFYKATYNFDDDDTGSHPAGWTISEGASTDIVIEKVIGTHRKVLSIKDWGGSSCYAQNVFSSGQAYGTIEFYFRAETLSPTRKIDIRFGWTPYGDAQTMFRILFDTSTMIVYRGGGTETIRSFVANTWYRFKITFDSTAGGYDGNGLDQFTIYVDDVNEGTWDFWHNHATMDGFRIASWGGSCFTPYKLYFDAFGYSWESNYNVGDNKYRNAYL